MRPIFRKLLPAAPLVAAAVALISGSRTAVAEGDQVERNERCANRISIALLGEAAPPAQFTSASPQSAVGELMKDPKFIERFSNFINSKFNDTPGTRPDEDASYYMTKYVLEQNKPWSEMFVGKNRVELQNPDQRPGNDNPVVVKDDPEGLGYFRSPRWLIRYAGNEPEGMLIVLGNRILQNAIGLHLVASTNAPDADVSATGRAAGVCRGCHFDNWYALDKVAAILGKRVGENNNVTFEPYTGGPQTILGGVQVGNDAQLVQALVGNEAFSVQACRLGFQYLYGRNENQCEGPLFDKCVESFKAEKTIQSAIRTVAADASFCE